MLLSMTTTVIGDPVAVPNPTRFDPTGRMMDGGPGVIVFLAGLVVLAVAGASVVIRLARSSGEERLQLRWIATATALAIVANIVVTTLSITFLGEAYADIPATIVTVLGFGILLPASFGVAVLRYRLYDLDFILNRTLLYGAVTVVLVAAFFVANLVAQQTLESAFNQRSDLVSAALGVAVGLAFGPMRRAARPLVDRFLPARSRLTLLFTDIVESTQAIVDLGDERWRDVLFRYRSLVRRELSRHRGREINTAGDAFFAVFDRPRSGVACAMAMRDGVKELGLSVRTGLHCGEVEVRGEQISGLAVHTAARVMSQAGGDQILVSDDVAQELDGAAALDEVGTRELRGVPGEWRLYEVRA
jgi:class 3 adenylate cyclase